MPPRTLTSEEQQRLIRRAQTDPVWFVNEVLGDTLWATQARVLEMVRDHRETAVASCHGAGKSFLAARAALWFLYTHYPSVVITTAPTDRQVRGILWRYIRTTHSKSRVPLGGTALTQELKLADDWWAMGFTAPEYDPDRFQGFHAEHVLVIVDEASGVGSQIYDAIDGILSAGHCRLLLIGNPTDPVGRFAKDFTTPGVARVKISAFETPNFTTFGITEADIADGTWTEKLTGPLPYPTLVTPEWVAERHARWRPESRMYLSRVRGEFPAQSADALIPLAWIQAAQQRSLPQGQPRILGVDVARHGEDSTVLLDRRGSWARVHASYPDNDTMQAVGFVVRALKETGAERAHIDGDGLGAGVYDRLAEQKQPAAEMRGGWRARDDEQFLNQRAEWYWGLRERFMSGEIDIDPHDDELAQELAEIRYSTNSRGQVVVESKDDLKKPDRLGRSPDRADALAMAFASPTRGRIPLQIARV